MSDRNAAPRPRPGRALVQMLVIVAVGGIIGLADAFVFRPVNLAARTAPPSIDELPLPTADGSARPRAAEPEKPPAPAGSPTTEIVPPSPPPATTAPIQPVPAAAEPASPAPAAGFAFTPKEKLPLGHITIDDARRLFDAGAAFVDSRKAEDYAAGHVRDAFRIDTYMFKDGDPPKLQLIARDSFVVVYCNGGNCDESDNLARLLDGSGYKKVYVMHDGFPGWRAAGHPTGTGPDPFDTNP
ncbi:MAG: rhodanese-like domain-containing protein [Phycisphaerales bacterium]